MPTKRETDRAFYEGVCCALAHVAACDQETLWREIVHGCGGDRRLRALSKRNGNSDIDGFTAYRAPKASGEQP
jgi:hypothetical protein